MEAYFHKANKILQHIHHRLTEWESSPDLSSRSFLLKTSEMRDHLSSLHRQVLHLENLSQKEITSIKREESKSRVARLMKEYEHVKSTWERLYQKAQEDLQQKEKHALLEQRNSSSSQQTTSFSESSPFPSRGFQQGSVGLSKSTGIDEEMAFQRTEQHLDDFLAMGKTILNGLVHQGETMKVAQRKLLDAANVMGLSREVIRFIERRSRQDQWMFYGLMILFLLIMYLLWRYLL